MSIVLNIGHAAEQPGDGPLAHAPFARLEPWSVD